jgi:AraC-like DNA-binding protein/quercetin dioxygenase-like cupin family protein
VSKKRMKKSKKKEPGNWKTPVGFENFNKRKLDFYFGATHFHIENVLFHIHEPNSVTQPHTHSDYQIVYYLKGKGEQQIGNEFYPVKSHTILFIPPNTVHQFQPESDHVATSFILQFSIDFESDVKKYKEDKEYQKLARMLFSKSFRNIDLAQNYIKKAGELIENTHEELLLQNFGYALAVKGNILLLLRLFLNSAISRDDFKVPLTRQQLIFIRAKAYINHNIDKVLTLAEVASFCSVSTSYIQKIFKANLCMSFSAYVHESKITHACHLLRNTDLSVKEIAWKCGVSDRNYFTRLFRNIIGQTPSQFKRKD